MAKPEADQVTLVDRILHRPPASGRTGSVPHVGHPFVSGSAGTHPMGRGAGGWVFLDDTAYDAHLCQACGHPETDPVHVIEDAED